MIRDITLGQYFPGESWIHRLDPRVKIMATLLFVVELFIVDTFWGFLAAVAALAVVIAVSKVPLSFILRGLKPIFLIIAFTFVLNLFVIPGKVLVEVGPLTITEEGVYTAFFMAFRLILLIIELVQHKQLFRFEKAEGDLPTGKKLVICLTSPVMLIACLGLVAFTVIRAMGIV